MLDIKVKGSKVVGEFHGDEVEACTDIGIVIRSIIDNIGQGRKGMLLYMLIQAADDGILFSDNVKDVHSRRKTLKDLNISEQLKQRLEKTHETTQYEHPVL